MYSTKSHHALLRAGTKLTLSLAVFFLAGCWEEKVHWSPDGAHATVLIGGQLHICSADGTLSPALLDDVESVNWLGDSERLVVVRWRMITSFAELATAFGPDRTKRLVDKSESVWRQIESGASLDDLGKNDDGFSAIALYLQEHHTEGMQAKLGADWDDNAGCVEWHSLVVARLIEGRIEIGETLYGCCTGFGGIVPAPNGRAVAFVTLGDFPPQRVEETQLLVVATDAGAPAAIVATDVAASIDWTPDSRTLVYLKSSGGAALSDEPSLGILVERNVLNASGQLEIAEESRDLSTLVLHGWNRVRCLQDGRVLFSGVEVQLPATEVNDRIRLFTIDRTSEEPTIVPVLTPAALETLPLDSPCFEPSPDGAEILFASEDGGVWRFSLANGAVTRIATNLKEEASSDSKSLPLPAWRGAGEFSFLRRSTGATPQLEFVLHHADGTETVLSEGWPSGQVQKLME